MAKDFHGSHIITFSDYEHQEHQDISHSARIEKSRFICRVKDKTDTENGRKAQLPLTPPSQLLNTSNKTHHTQPTAKFAFLRHGMLTICLYFPPNVFILKIKIEVVLWSCARGGVVIVDDGFSVGVER